MPLHLEVRGDGPPLVLLHGFTQTGRLWGPFGDGLAATHTLIAIDLPGHGDSGDVRADLPETAALVRDVVRLRRIKRRAQPLGLLAVRGALLGSSPKVATPTAIGYLHPAIVIPDGFGSRVDGTEWAAVVAHECAHLSRGDDWAKALQSAVLRAGWWLPGLRGRPAGLGGRGGRRG